MKDFMTAFLYFLVITNVLLSGYYSIVDNYDRAIYTMVVAIFILVANKI
jgi:hypothetical protein